MAVLLLIIDMNILIACYPFVRNMEARKANIAIDTALFKLHGLIG